MLPFVDRVMQLEKLSSLWNDHKHAQSVLLYGRRRMGKTYLLQHFLNDKSHAYFLASDTSLSQNLADLAHTVLELDPDSGYTLSDLASLPNILRFMSHLASTRRVGLVLDEFQYLISSDPSIPSQIQAWWDKDGIRSEIMLVLCGSHIGMMSALESGSNPLYGRFNVTYQLPPMNYRQVAEFYAESGYSARDILLAYGILGGTPRYHALMDVSLSLDENIILTVLSPMGFLTHEPEVLMSSTQTREAAAYNSIIRAVAQGHTRNSDISGAADIPVARMQYTLRNLLEWDWIRREYPYGDTREKMGLYKITDPFLMFYYHVMNPFRSELAMKPVEGIYHSRIEPMLNGYMGKFVFEGICKQHLMIVGHHTLPSPVKTCGRYWERDGTHEIDIVGHLEDRSLLLAECKWSSKPIGVAVLQSLLAKRAAWVAAHPADEKLNCHYLLYSLAGFDDHTSIAAEAMGVGLIDGELMLN
ncbi:MAG: ATP-binding protein [Armatimonadota bacterium]